MLIQKGAIPVDFNGTPASGYESVEVVKTLFSVNEAEVNYEDKITVLLQNGEYTIKDILKRLQLTWSVNELRDFLTKKKDVEEINKRPLRYTLKKQKLLFD